MAGLTQINDEARPRIVKSADGRLGSLLRFARKMAHPRYANRTGIVVAAGVAHEHPPGLATYKAEDDLQFGHVWTVGHFVAFDMLDRQPVAEAWIAAVESLGRELKCDTVR